LPFSHGNIAGSIDTRQFDVHCNEPATNRGDEEDLGCRGRRRCEGALETTTNGKRITDNEKPGIRAERAGGSGKPAREQT
jgi:hypothetical protein